MIIARNFLIKSFVDNNIQNWKQKLGNPFDRKLFLAVLFVTVAVHIAWHVLYLMRIDRIVSIHIISKFNWPSQFSQKGWLGRAS